MQGRLYAIRYRNDIQENKFGTYEKPKWQLVNVDMVPAMIQISQGPIYTQQIRSYDIQGWGVEGIIAKQFWLQCGRFNHYFKFAAVQRDLAKDFRTWIQGRDQTLHL